MLQLAYVCSAITDSSHIDHSHDRARSVRSEPENAPVRAFFKQLPPGKRGSLSCELKIRFRGPTFAAGRYSPLALLCATTVANWLAIASPWVFSRDRELHLKRRISFFAQASAKSLPAFVFVLVNPEAAKHLIWPSSAPTRVRDRAVVLIHEVSGNRGKLGSRTLNDPAECPLFRLQCSAAFNPQAKARSPTPSERLRASLPNRPPFVSPTEPSISTPTLSPGVLPHLSRSERLVRPSWKTR